MNSKRRSHRPAFTLVELLTVIAIIGILAGLLFPAISGVFGSANTTKSLANIREIGKVAQLYANDNNFKSLPARDEVDLSNPGTESWLDILAFYTTQRSGKPEYYTKNFSDPMWYFGGDPDFDEEEIGIALNITPGTPEDNDYNDATSRNGKHFSLSSIHSQPMRVLAIQWDDPTISEGRLDEYGFNSVMEDRGQKGVNVVFFDGHTETISEYEVAKNGIEDPAQNLKNKL